VNADFSIVELDRSSWPLVSETVLRLLAELGEEAADLGELDDERVRAEWERRPDSMRVLAATRDGESLGLITLTESFAVYANGRYGIIAEMYVVPEARSAGVGAALIEAAVRLGKSLGWSRIDVTAPADPGATRTQAFYRRHGFTFAGPKLKLPL
jgi:GNAT superfamily N-acetyltransferase